MAQRNYFSCVRTFVGECALVLDGSLDGSIAAQFTLLVVKAQALFLYCTGPNQVSIALDLLYGDVIMTTYCKGGLVKFLHKNSDWLIR